MQPNSIVVENKHPEVREDKALHGTMRALLANMVEGVSKGFEKKLEVYGTGYTVKEQGGKLVLQVGFANPVEMAIPQGVKVKIEVAATRGDDTPAKFTSVVGGQMRAGPVRRGRAKDKTARSHTRAREFVTPARS